MSARIWDSAEALSALIPPPPAIGIEYFHPQGLDHFRFIEGNLFSSCAKINHVLDPCSRCQSLCSRRLASRQVAPDGARKLLCLNSEAARSN